MTDDLYATLGVDKTASKDDVKAAYKRRARKAHPDAGGSSEAMTALTVAYSTLGDDEKRAQYDATGKYGSTIGEAQTQAMSLINQIYNQLIEKPEAIRIDLVFEATRNVNNMKAQAEAHLQKLDGLIKTFDKMRKRVKTRKGPNVLGNLFDQRIQMAEQGIEITKRDLEKMKLALELLKDEKFEPDLAQPSATFVSFGQIRSGTSTTGW